MPRALVVTGMLCATTPFALASQDLVRQINAYRTSSAACNGHRMAPVDALGTQAALARVRVVTGTMLPSALEQLGYRAEHVEAISVSGPADSAAVFNLLLNSYCASLRDPRFKAIGVARSGDTWQIVLAQPAPPRPPPPPPLPPVTEIGPAALDAVNRVRAVARSCGPQHFPAAPPLTLNNELNRTALSHSRDMAFHGYFAHQGKDGGGVGQRARAAGYAWAGIAENIAYGQRSIEEAVASWVTSPGHCVNLMNPVYTQMGIAYAQDTIQRRPYWTQVLGLPR